MLTIKSSYNKWIMKNKIPIGGKDTAYNVFGIFFIHRGGRLENVTLDFSLALC